MTTRDDMGCKLGCVRVVMIGVAIGCSADAGRLQSPSTQQVRLTDGAVLPPDGLPVRTLNVLTVALLDRMKNQPPDEIAFIAVGDDRLDAPQELIARLRTAHEFVEPATAARLPRRGEMTGPATDRSVEDPRTGRPGSLDRVAIVRWVSNEKVRVRVSRYGGPLDGGGIEETLEMGRSGWWWITGSDRCWAS